MTHVQSGLYFYRAFHGVPPSALLLRGLSLPEFPSLRRIFFSRLPIAQSAVLRTLPLFSPMFPPGGLLSYYRNPTVALPALSFPGTFPSFSIRRRKTSPVLGPCESLSRISYCKRCCPFFLPFDHPLKAVVKTLLRACIGLLKPPPR